MHVTNAMIREELRPAGKVIRRIIPAFTERTFRVINRVMKPMRHRNFSRSLRMDEITIDRPDGSGLRMVIYRPAHELTQDVPGILWIHGGGYAIGIPEQDFGFAEDLMAAHDCVIFMPDYTLACEAPFPAAFDDCYLALRYVVEHAEEYRVRRDQVFTGGDSAGGGLCAAVDLKARDTREVNVAFTMPLYPMLDAEKTPSSTDNDAPLWNTKSNEAGWNLYLQGQEPTKYASPALEEDLTGFPPTLTFVGSIEPFLDETIAFVDRLEDAGVDVECRKYYGCFHAFDTVCPYTKIAQEAQAFLREGFAHACDTYVAENPRRAHSSPASTNT